MENNTEVIRQQMTETRASLSDKLEALEDQVLATVQDTRETVSETVEEVKEAVENTVETVTDTVKETVESVKETLDLRHQVENHPWAMLAGAVAVGYIGTKMLLPSSTADRAVGNGSPTDHSPSALASDTRSSSAETGGWLANLRQTLGPALDKLKSLAIGTTASVVSNMLLGSASGQLRQHFTEVIDQITTSLGGKPIHDPPQNQGQESNGLARDREQNGSTGRPIPF